jgi:hypothetical protein
MDSDQFKSLDIVFNTLANIIIGLCILSIIIIPLAIWKIIDLIRYVF